MATAKLSAIITAIAGTVGGVTFRRHNSTTVVSAKSMGTSKTANRLNQRLPELRNLMFSWQLLTPASRSDWAAAALNFTFPDKFGNLRNLPGRLLYLKLQGNQIVVNGPSINPLSLNGLINLGVNPLVSLSYSAFDGWSVVLNIDSVISDTLILIQAQLVSNPSQSSSNGRRQVLYYANASAQTSFDFSLEFMQKFPNTKVGDTYRFYLTYQNLSGFRSVPINVSGTFVNI